ncbi:MAG: VWA domain-containing protein [Chthoniobacter sp.]
MSFWNPPWPRENYVRRLGAHIDALRDTCQRLGILFVPISSTHPLETVLFDFLKAPREPRQSRPPPGGHRMSFLAPLFALGALAVAGPILFHLIRRTTREKTPFSTLMFLDPSHRASPNAADWKTWGCSCCAVSPSPCWPWRLPAFSPARAARPQPGSGQRVVILADTSASMRRGTLWADARARIEARLVAAHPQDEIAVLTFDREVRTVMSFEDWKKTAPNERAATALQRLGSLAPGWNATRLDAALLQSVEALDQADASLQGKREIVVVSDMQEGAQLDGLQG